MHCTQCECEECSLGLIIPLFMADGEPVQRMSHQPLLGDSSCNWILPSIPYRCVHMTWANICSLCLELELSIPNAYWLACLTAQLVFYSIFVFCLIFTFSIHFLSWVVEAIRPTKESLAYVELPAVAGNITLSILHTYWRPELYSKCRWFQKNSLFSFYVYEYLLACMHAHASVWVCECVYVYVCVCLGSLEAKFTVTGATDGAELTGQGGGGHNWEWNLSFYKSSSILKCWTISSAPKRWMFLKDKVIIIKFSSILVSSEYHVSKIMLTPQWVQERKIKLAMADHISGLVQRLDVWLPWIYWMSASSSEANKTSGCHHTCGPVKSRRPALCLFLRNH